MELFGGADLRMGVLESVLNLKLNLVIVFVHRVHALLENKVLAKEGVDPCHILYNEDWGLLGTAAEEVLQVLGLVTWFEYKLHKF